MNLNVTIKGLKEVQAKIEKMEKEAPELLDRNMKKACIMVENQVRLNVSGVALPMTGGGWRSQSALHVRSGHLRNSYTSKVELHGMEVIGRVGSPLVYAPVHEFGAHIVAKNKPYLTFPIKIMGMLGKTGKMKSRKEWVRVKEVTIPARHPLYHAGNQMKAAILAMFDKVVGVWAKDTGGSTWRQT